MNRFLFPFLLFVVGISNPLFAQAPACCNILTNGDFEDGNVGFSSDLPQVCGCSGTSYCVNTNFQTKCSGWQNVPDHTSGSGNFLIVDGEESSPVPVDVWQVNTTITAGTEYCFSFWVASQYDSPFDLGLAVNGNPVPGAVFSVQQSPASWTQYSVTWTATGAGSNISIQQLAAGDFQDFGIDDIEFGQALTANFSYSPDISCGMNVSFFNQSTGPAPLTYSWNFGDPNSPSNISNQPNPTHNFTDCGTYDVCLTVTRGSCSQTYCQSILVEDIDPPTALCADPSILLDANCMATVTPNMINSGSFDNCYIASITVSPNTLSGCGLHPVTLTVRDSCGNTSSCTSNVQASEAIPPKITCPANVSVNAIPSACTIVVNGIKWLSATDNCGTPTVSYVATGGTPASGNNDASGTVFNQGTNTVTYTAKDGCGNTTSCSFSVNVTCAAENCACPAGGASGANLIANGNFSSGLSGFGSGLVQNTSCGAGSYNVDKNFYLFCPLWDTLPDHTNDVQRKYLILDGADNGINTKTDLWTSNVTITANTNYCFSFWWASAYANADLNFNIEAYIRVGTTDYVLGTTQIVQNTIVWTSASYNWNSGPSVSGPQTIRIRQISGDDHRDFGIDDICFRGEQVPCVAAFSSQNINNCGNVQFTSISTGPAGLTYCWDFDGNPSTCESTLPNPAWQFSACGTYNVCLTISGNGCSATICHTVMVTDNTPPTITCPGNLSVQGFIDAQGFCRSFVNNIGAVAADNCPGLSLTYAISSPTGGSGSNDASGTVFQQGTSTVTYTSTDWCGNKASCSLSVTVECHNCICAGTQGPELVTNGNFNSLTPISSSYNYDCTNQQSGFYCVTTNPALVNAAYTPCMDVSGTGGMLVANGSSPSTEIWCQVFNNLTPNTNYIFTYWVASVTAASPAQIQLYLNNAPYGSLGQAIASPCLWRQYCQMWNSGNNTSVTLCLKDVNTTAAGNDFAIDEISFRACSQPQPCGVTITANPTPFCGTGTLTANPTGLAPFSYQWSHGQATQSINVQSLPCGSVCTVSVTCADGSVTSASYTVTDIVPPIAVCKLGIGVDLGANCTFQVTPAFVDGGSTDNCQILSMSVSPTVLQACTNTIVTLTVTDWCNNTSTCTMGIQTAESVPPIMTCPANTTIIGTVGPNGLCTATYQPAKPPAIDNCDPSVTVTNNAPAVFQQGPTTITWTATDDCGNQTTCTQMVTVQCNCDCPNNLVTNGGFENGTAGFPNAINQINQCSGWYAATNNPAANNTGDWYWDPSFPGYYLAPAQTALPAHCGQKYAGFFLNTCEGITTQLSQTIQQGCSYEVGFWWTPATTPTAPFSFYAVMSGGNCTMYHPSGTCSHSCNGDQHVIVNATPANVAGTWYYHSMTVVNAYPNVGYMTFTAAQGAPNVNNYIFVDDVCVKKIVEPCSVTASIICYPENPIAYTAQATLGCGSLVTQVDWYFDGLGPNSNSNLNSILHPFTTIGWHTVCLVVTASNDGGHTICKDSICKQVFIDHVPPTKCEKVLVNWQKLRTEESLCCYELQVDNLEPNCFTEIELTLNSGTFINSSIPAGWNPVGNLNSPQISLIPAGGFLPTGFFSPIALCNPGGTGPYNLTVNLKYGPPPSEKCEKNFQFDCPDTPIDSCCLDYDLFCQNVMNAVSVTVDNANCKATLNIGTLPDCDYIQKIIWGDGTQNTGNFGSGSMPMHTYGQSGTYVIQYLALELNPHTGLICFEKLLTETIEVVCSDCCKDEQAFQIAASAVQISSVYGNCSISVNATNMNDCLRVTWNWGDGSPTEGPYPNNTPLSHTYSTYGLFVVSCTISEVNQFGVTCFSNSFSLPQRVECYYTCPDCENNLVKNPGFFEGAVSGELGASGASNDWSAAPTTTPDVSDGIFCCDAFGIQMFGSQDDGEAICQAINFDPNKTYSISFSAYYFQPASIAPYVQFGFYASNGCVNPFPNCAGCETMGISPQITDQNCATYTLPDWTPTANYNTLIIKALNANLFPSLSFGRIDNICIQEVGGCIKPPTGMVSWWTMDDAYGDPLAIDLYGNNDGVPLPGGALGGGSGPDPVAGKVAGALQFISPGNNHLFIADNASQNFGSGSFSIDAWVNSNLGTGTEPIVDKLGNTNNGYSFSLQSTTLGPPFYPTLVLGLGTTVQVLQGPPVTTNDWNFVAVSVDGQQGIATFCVGNGTSGFTTLPVAISGAYNASNSGLPLLIGGNPLNVHWNIIIDELEVFGRAVSAAEFEAIFNADSLGKCKSIVAVKNLTGMLPIRIYPNPNPGTFTVELPEPANPGMSFRITDLTGRLVQEQKTESGSAQQTVRAGELPAGLYFLQVVSEGKVLAVEKFVKQ